MYPESDAAPDHKILANNLSGVYNIQLIGVTIINQSTVTELNINSFKYYIDKI